MPIPAAPLRRGDRGDAVAALHRTLEAINRVIDPADRDRRIFGVPTEGVIRDFQTQAALPVTGVYDDATRAAIVRMLADIGPFSVYGHVADADGMPIVGATIFAVDVDLRRTEVLGQTKTDSGGDYEIRYAASKFTRAEKASADILVRAVLGDQKLAESGVTFNAPVELEVDLASTSHRGPSELERLLAELMPLLDGATIDQLGPADVGFLTGETGLASELWQALIAAQAMVAVAPRDLPLAALYGWRRTGQPATWAVLSAVTSPTLRAALVDALDRNLIPAALRADLDKILALVPNADRDHLGGVLGAAAVPPEVQQVVLGQAGNVAAISDEMLGRLVADGSLAAAHADRIGLAASVQVLTGGTPDGVAKVLKLDIPALPNGLVAARDLTALDPGDWVRALQAAGAAIPEGTTIEAHARTRAIAATQAFPKDALRHRVGRVPDQLDQHAAQVRKLLARDPKALDRPVGELADADRVAVGTVRGLVNTHPGLGLRELFAGGGADAAKVATTRIGWLGSVVAKNPEVKFLELDYLPDAPSLAQVDFGDLPAEARPLVLADLRAHRRMHAVAGNMVATYELMTAGFASASALARTPATDVATRTDIPATELASIRTTALAQANVAALQWFGAYDLARDHATTPVRSIPTRQQFFHQFDGFANLIADEPWCACDECQSVTSPAAYFVDLMHYVEEYILADSFAGQPKHPLHLEQRRPDLWDLPLSCANTKEFVPYLDVVNEVLERYLRDTIPLAAGASVYGFLAEQDGSLRQPFTLPIDRIDTLLGHFKLSRGEVAATLRAPRAIRARARLGLSLRGYALITTERTDAAYLKRLFGFDTAVIAPDAALAAIELGKLVTATALDHDVLVAALTSAFVGATVVLGKRDPNDVQNNTEVATNLTLRKLDRLHRFLRLWRTLPWTVAELDYVLGRFGGPQIVADTAAGPGTLERIAELLDLADPWSIPLDQVLAITDAFPTAVVRDPTPLFDRLFNPPAFVAHDGAWTPQTAGRFTHPSWPTVGALPADDALARLLGGLQLSDRQLVDLVAGLHADPALDWRAATAAASESISLARAAITSLYRHARVRALLALDVDDFLTMLALIRGPGGYLRDAADIRTLRDAVAWQRASDRSIAELAYLTGGARPANLPDPAVLAAALPAAISGIGDPASRAAILAGATPLALLDLALGSQLGRSPGEVALLRAFTAPLAAGELAAVVRAMTDPAAVAADVARVVALVGDVARFHRLFPSAAFDAAALGFVRQQRTVFFGAPPAGAEVVTLDAIRKVDAYAALITAANPGYTTESGEVDPAAVAAVVGSIATATDAQLASALRTDAARIAALRPALTLPAQPFDALGLLAANLALADRLGVSGATLARMVDESNPAATFDQLSRAADDVLGAFRARYPDPADLTAKLEPYEDVLRGRQRDGLVDYITRRWPTPFTGADQLYEYFLLDVMMQGCARTSRIVAAMSSVQLYVHRVLANLERSDDGIYAHFTDPERRGEWSWRQHYRVWEANRKVFLYPENYIEPALRDDKTPLFEELEDTLLMQDITPANVQDAYGRYLTGFDGLAHLTIAGAYRDKIGKTLHLFGVTCDDAPVYYYRAIDESQVTPDHPAPLFSPWHKLDLQIPVRKVSPYLFDGRLYLFWVETATRPMNTFTGGSSAFGGYRHTMRIKFSTLRLDGGWTAPQVIRFADSGGVADARIVEDPLDLTRKKRLEDQQAALAQQRTALDQVKRTAAEAVNQAQITLSMATANRIQKKRDLDAGLDVGQAIAFGVLVGGGVPPDLAWLIVKGSVAVAWRAAVDAENAANEALNLAKDSLANIQSRLDQLDQQLADLAVAIANEKVHVRWDRSLRDHTNALDSYKPDGWAFDRVYAGSYVPPRPDLPPELVKPDTMRLTLVPYGDRPSPPDELPIQVGDFDPVAAVLRDPLVPASADSQYVSTYNWVGGLVQRFQADFIAYRGQDAVVAAFWLEARDSDIGRVHRSSTAYPIAVAPPTADVQIVPGALDSLIVQFEGDSVWLRPLGAGSPLGMRLSTSLTRPLMRVFWSGGPTALLDANVQRLLVETRSRISPIAGQSDPDRQSPFHPEHPCLVYFRETFFHIPFLIADHLNGEQDFAGAQRWYHTIFDPTAADGQPWRNRELAVPDPRTTTLRDLLVDSAALAAYREDPFNPHAIARTRMSAYAKSIVMKYIDNLLDWGDSLFAQFTMESVNEATMLYVMARDVLGPRPATLGACGTTDLGTLTYRTVRAGLGEVSDFLVELESPSARPAWQASTTSTYVVGAPAATAKAVVALPAPRPRMLLRAGMAAAPEISPVGDPPPLGGVLALGGPGAAAQTPVAVARLGATQALWTRTTGTPLTAVRTGATAEGAALTVAGTARQPAPADPPDVVQGFAPGSVGVRGEPLAPFGELATKYGAGVVDVQRGSGGRDDVQVVVSVRNDINHYPHDPIDVVPAKTTVFCIPPNQELLGYWDRVEDRLFKIRNCMDISGARRQLALFAPELDPRMLVRMTAAGLSIDDILALAAAELPPYRFTYLIEKAKQYAQTVQSFGSQLAAALEKGDAEELNQLRTVHEQNLLSLRTKLAQQEIDAAEATLASLQAQRDAVEYRRQHFVALREAGTLAEERKQQQLQREASQYRTAAAVAQVVASILTVIPDFGAPTAMKFGGSQLGAAGRAVGEGLGALAAFNDSNAAMAGIEAATKRRDQEWQHQEESARRELLQLDKSIAAAGIRRDIAVRSLEVHERTIEQSEEMFAFFRDKFSSVDRYRVLTKDLRRLYRIAFDAALAVARMAERAYRAERDDDDMLVGGYWSADNAGLLAGERLLVDLQRLERQFVERNHRQLEVEHSFSLAQLAPDKLAELRLTGACAFDIPEWFFDLTYPGQLKRRIRAVRVTMPCVTGPYTNVGATLRLTGSKIRLTAPVGQNAALGALTDVPLGHSVAIAASKAQADAGMFEFSFRDERYMPFEGAGAISSWSLALPRTLRVFDYDTITDVLLHLSYTADDDAELRRRWDTAAQLVALLAADDANGKPRLVRRFSLRDEFPDAWHRLVTGAPGTEVGIAIDARHFALFLAGHTLDARAATLELVSPLDDLQGAAVELGVTRTAPPTAFVRATAPVQPTGGIDGGLRAFDCGSVLQAAGAGGVAPAVYGPYTLRVAVPGALGTANAIDPSLLADIVLRVGYRLAQT